MQSPVESFNLMIFLSLFDIFTDESVILLSFIDIFTSVKWGAVLYSFSPSTEIEE